MELDKGWGDGIEYKESTYTSKGVTISNDYWKFQNSPYKVPIYSNGRYNYNLIFNLNEYLRRKLLD